MVTWNILIPVKGNQISKTISHKKKLIPEFFKEMQTWLPNLKQQSYMWYIYMELIHKFVERKYLAYKPLFSINQSLNYIFSHIKILNNSKKKGWGAHCLSSDIQEACMHHTIVLYCQLRIWVIPVGVKITDIPKTSLPLELHLVLDLLECLLS